MKQFFQKMEWTMQNSFANIFIIWLDNRIQASPNAGIEGQSEYINQECSWLINLLLESHQKRHVLEHWKSWTKMYKKLRSRSVNVRLSQNVNRNFRIRLKQHWPEWVKRKLHIWENGSTKNLIYRWAEN